MTEDELVFFLELVDHSGGELNRFFLQSAGSWSSPRKRSSQHQQNFESSI